MYDHPGDDFVASFLGTPPMNLVEHDDGLLGFRPEHFLPREMLDGAVLSELPFPIDRMGYLGSERILYRPPADFRPTRHAPPTLSPPLPLSPPPARPRPT